MGFKSRSHFWKKIPWPDTGLLLVGIQRIAQSDSLEKDAFSND